MHANEMGLISWKWVKKFHYVISATMKGLRWALKLGTAASADQTAPATHASANEQRPKQSRTVGLYK